MADTREVAPEEASLIEIRQMMAELLERDIAGVDDGDNLIGHGVDSITMMKLAGRLRRAGYTVGFGDLAAQPSLAEWATLLTQQTKQDTAGPAAHPPEPAEPFDLTAVQRAYWIGRNEGMVLGGVACHAYFEFDGRDVDPGRLEHAVRRVIDRHEMLRARILDTGQQQILDRSPWPGLIVHDIRHLSISDTAARLNDIFEGLSHQVLDVTAGEVLDVRLSLLPNHKTRLHLSIDLLVADVASIQIVLADLAAFYREPDRPSPPVDYGFQRYLADLQPQRAKTIPAARDYWRRRLDDLPSGGPQLPLAVAPEHIERPRFRRRTFDLSPTGWHRLAETARTRGLTPAMVLAAAYAEVLGAWSAQQRFLVNVPLFDRQPIHPAVNDLVADFTNLILLAADVSAPLPFEARVRELQRQFQEDISHADYSALDVLRDLAAARGGERVTAPVVFASNLGVEFVGEDFRSTFGEFDRMISQTPQVWLDHQVYEVAGGLRLVWDAVEELFPDGVLDAMFETYQRLLTWLSAQDADWSRPVPTLVPAEQLRSRAEVNATEAQSPAELLHEGFVRQVMAHPERVALTWGDGATMSYGDLFAHANAVAGALRARGCAAGELVAVIAPRGWEQVAAVFGILLARCAYLPVDLNQPAARRDRILADAGVRTVLTQSTVDMSRLPGPIAVDQLAPVARDDVPDLSTPLDELAYVIYTSGSTGQPKGVMVSHRAAVNTVADINRRFGVGADDRVLGLANLGFDLSVYDIFGTLAVGGALVLPDPNRPGDPSHWAALVDRWGVTVWNSVPAQLQMLWHFLAAEPDTALPSLRLAMMSGDWIPVGLPDQIWTRLPGLRLISLGGATEAAIWSIYHPIERVDPDLPSIPYGKPLANQSFHVLDSALRHRPQWVPGELFIGGAGLAMGYLGDRTKTDERFIVHPETGERLYRTGDLGRYLPDGDIEFLGRADFQVKIRGHRIELAEIESALQTHPGVGTAVAIVDGDRAMERRLAAFVQPAIEPVPPDDGPAIGAELTELATAEGMDIACAVDNTRLDELLPRLAAAALLSMVDTLRQAGLFPTAESRHGVEEIIHRLHVAPPYHRVVRRWLKALRHEGMVRLDQATEEYFGLARTDPGTVRDAWDLVERTHSDDLLWPAPVLGMFRRSAEQLLALLRGDLDQVQLLFPEGGVEIAEAAYTEGLIVRYLNRAARAMVRRLAKGWDAGRAMRVLEVGAGIGGTGAQLIEELAAHDARYLFTDVSQFFLNQAQQRFEQYPWVHYGLFDMNDDYRGQGLEPNSFDVIVCANVLHNAENVDDVLGRLRELLTPGGWLIFTEITREHYELMISMEFLVRLDEDRRDFHDRRRGNDQTFFAPWEWRELLTAAGADTVVCLPGDDVLGRLGQHLLAARFKSGRAALDATELQTYLTRQVPEYMVPSHIQVVDTLPLTGNGKVDRARLPGWLPHTATGATRGGGEPESELERRLCGLWAELLGRERVGRDDDFFALGGDSLLMTHLTARVRDEIPEAADIPFRRLLRNLLARPTVSGLAEHLERP